MSHTPGPWEVDAGETVNVRDAKMETTLARVLWLRGHYGQLGRIPELEVMANARLIAAAPELLRTLQALQRMTAPGNRTLDDFMHDMGYANDLIRAAIATATGGDK